MIELDWTGGPAGSACEHGHLCAWIQELVVDERFVWTVDTPGDDDPEEIVNLAVGVAASLDEAREVVAGVMIELGASPAGSWRSRPGTNIVDLFPARHPVPPDKRG
jgi:hypothetical protein